MKTIRKNFIYNLLLTISNVLFPVFTFPYASRILGPEGIGKVHFVSNFVQYFVLIAALGIPIYGIREVAKLKHQPKELKTLFTTLLLLNLFTSLILFVVYTAIVYLVPSLYADREFYTVAVFMLVLSFCNIDWFFSGLERFKFIAMRSLFVKFVFLIILYIIVKNEADDINYLWVIVGSAILNNIWNIISARRYFDFNAFKLNDLKKHLRPLFYIFSTVLAASVYSTLDTIVLGFIKGFEDVGFYSAASRINRLSIPFLTSLASVLMPQIAHAFKEKETDRVKYLVKNSFDFVILLGIPMTIGLMALAPELIVLFSGSEFMPSIVPMQLMAPVVLIIGLSTVWSVQVLTPSGRDKEASVSVIGGLIVSVFLNFLLIPRFGYIGATISNLLAELTVMCGFAYFASKALTIEYDFKLIFKTLGASLVFFPIIYLLRNLVSTDIIAVSILGIIICSTWYFTFQIFIMKNELLRKQIISIKERFNI